MNIETLDQHEQCFCLEWKTRPSIYCGCCGGTGYCDGSCDPENVPDYDDGDPLPF